MALSGRVEVALPIGRKPSAEYRKALYNTESGQYALPDKGVVSFSFDAGDALSQVVTLSPNQKTVTLDVTARVTEAALLP